MQQPTLTLVAICTVCHELTRLAVNETLRHIAPKEVLIFSDREIGVPGARTLPCHVKNNFEAEQFMWHGIQPYLPTDHVLMVQWDSWCIRPDLWDQEFLAYDYIGAPWPWFQDGLDVGNGGFTIRSRRLVDILAKNKDRFPFSQPEDIAICRTHRPALEEHHGIRFAPLALAKNFAVEQGEWNGWGFHGLWNFPRFLDDAALMQRIALLPQNYLGGSRNFELLVNWCRALGKGEALNLLTKMASPAG